MTALSDREVSYVAGTWVALAGADTWLLVDLPLNSSLVMSLWQLVRAGTPADDLLDALTAEGIRSAPSFALVRLASDERRAIVRGAASVHLVSADGDSSFAAVSGATWADHQVPTSLDELSLASSSVTGVLTQLPMSMGVTSAALVLISASTLPVVLPRVTIPTPSAVPEPMADIDPVVPVEPVVVAEPPVVVGPMVPDPEPEPQPEPAVERLVEREPLADVNTYDSLFGQTINPVQVVPGWKAPEDPVMVEAVPDMQVAPSAFATQDWGAVQVESDSGLIDGVPWLTGASASRAPSVAEPAIEAAPAPEPVVRDAPPSSPEPQALVQEQDVRTVSRAELLAEAAATATGPHVLAVYCPQGHLTPPHSATCRVCGAAVAEQAAVNVARPPLGVLRLPTGDQVVLDRGVVVGRAPDSHATEDRPHLVRLTTPENEISRSHAEIVLDGWNVLVRDLGSTNGTTVALPGQPPLRLRGDDLFALEPNSAICLADQLSITFEVTA